MTTPILEMRKQNGKVESFFSHTDHRGGLALTSQLWISTLNYVYCDADQENCHLFFFLCLQSIKLHVLLFEKTFSQTYVCPRLCCSGKELEDTFAGVLWPVEMSTLNNKGAAMLGLHSRMDITCVWNKSGCLENSNNLWWQLNKKIQKWGDFPKHITVTIIFLRKNSTTCISALLPKALTCSDTFSMSNEVNWSVLGHRHCLSPLSISTRHVLAGSLNLGHESRLSLSPDSAPSQPYGQGQVASLYEILFKNPATKAS